MAHARESWIIFMDSTPQSKNIWVYVKHTVFLLVLHKKWVSNQPIILLPDFSWFSSFQNAYYTGWMCLSYCSNIIKFVPNGSIIKPIINTPGSWHDSNIADCLYCWFSLLKAPTWNPGLVSHYQRDYIIHMLYRLSWVQDFGANETRWLTNDHPIGKNQPDKDCISVCRKWF